MRDALSSSGKAGRWDVRCRFVNRHGWEKWIDVSDPPPDVWKLADDIENVPVTAFAEAQPRASTYRVRLYVRQPWNVAPWPREHVYVEEGLPLDDSDRFGPEYPSLHREREQRRCIDEIAEVVENAGKTENALVEALVARETVDRIEVILERWRRRTSAKSGGR